MATLQPQNLIQLKLAKVEYNIINPKNRFAYFRAFQFLPLKLGLQKSPFL